MPSRARTFLFGGRWAGLILIGFAIVGCTPYDCSTNELPRGDQLENYNQAITEIESEQELDEP